MITPEEISKFEKSDLKTKAYQIVASADLSKRNISLKEAVHVRDYILTQLTLDNAQRSGAIRNITIGAFRKSIFIDDKKVALVQHHKTSHTGGDARIGFEANMASLTRIYI